MDRSGIFTWEEKDRIGILKVATGEKGNMVPRPEFADRDKVAGWINQKDIAGVIVSGEGRHFSVGADLGYFKGKQYSREMIEKQFESGAGILDCLADLEKPVIASIDGACLGLGLEIALACHLRFCSRNALFGFPEIGHGIIPGQGGLQRLLALAGESRTLEIALTGEVFGAELARHYGVINRIVQTKSALDFSVAFILKITGMGKKPVAYTIRAVKNASRFDFDTAVREECRLFAELVMDQHGTEGSAGGNGEQDQISG